MWSVRRPGLGQRGERQRFLQDRGQRRLEEVREVRHGCERGWRHHQSPPLSPPPLPPPPRGDGDIIRVPTPSHPARPLPPHSTHPFRAELVHLDPLQIGCCHRDVESVRGDLPAAPAAQLKGGAAWRVGGRRGLCMNEGWGGSEQQLGVGTTQVYMGREKERRRGRGKEKGRKRPAWSPLGPLQAPEPTCERGSGWGRCKRLGQHRPQQWFRSRAEGQQAGGGRRGRCRRGARCGSAAQRSYGRG